MPSGRASQVSLTSVTTFIPDAAFVSSAGSRGANQRGENPEAHGSRAHGIPGPSVPDPPGPGHRDREPGPRVVPRPAHEDLLDHAAAPREGARGDPPGIPLTVQSGPFR